jgi:hypothetical protein
MPTPNGGSLSWFDVAWRLAPASYNLSQVMEEINEQKRMHATNAASLACGGLVSRVRVTSNCAARGRLAEVRQSRDDWKAQAERLALAARLLQPPAPTPSLVPAPSEPDQRRPWWRRLAG